MVIAGHEAVALRLREGIGPLHLDGVLRGDHHEGARQAVGLSVGRDLPLRHRLQERGLGLRGGAVDLVAHDDVGEDPALLELELARRLVENRHAGHVAGEQVGGELDARDVARDRPGERLGELRLSDAGDVLDEEVPLGEEDRDRDPQLFGLALDHLAHLRDDGGREMGDLGQRGQRVLDHGVSSGRRAALPRVPTPQEACGHGKVRRTDTPKRVAWGGKWAKVARIGAKW